MKVKWLIQDTNIRLDIVNGYFEVLQKLGFDFHPIGIDDRGYVTNITEALEKDCLFILKSGTRAVKKIHESSGGVLNFNPFELQEEWQKDVGHKIHKNLWSGVFYDIKKFDQKYYSKLDLPLLNNSAHHVDLNLNIHESYDTDMFIKPSRDLKAFDSGILKAGTTIKEYIESVRRQNFYKSETAIIAPIKKINNEYRFCVVDGSVISGSLYNTEGEVKYDSNVPKKVIDCAEEFANLYKPHDVFVMDIAETPKGYKIIEYNCWNASGLYHCDLEKTFKAVNEYVSER